MWWADMANCLYPAFIGASDACERLDLCKVREWTCDDCTAVMTRVANFMKEADTIAQGVAVLTVSFPSHLWQTYFHIRKGHLGDI